MFKLSSKKSIYLLIILFIIFPSVILNYFFLEVNNPNSSIKITVLADSTPDVDLDELPDIPYDVLNEMWYDPKIEMLIITPDDNQAFANACKPLMDWKNEKGVKTIILSNYSSYPGEDPQEKIRNMIKYYYERENVQWVLLCGDAEPGLIPIREVYNPDVIDVGQGDHESVGNDYNKSTDFYYADLTGTWNDNGNDKWGESAEKTKNNINKDEIEWIPDVYVGRFPANDKNELEIMINKSLKYEINPEIGDWMNRMLLAGAVSSLSPNLEDEAVLTKYIWNNYVLNEIEFTHLHKEYSPYDPPVPPAPNRQEDLTSTNINSELNNLGYSTVIIASHGFVTDFTDVSEGSIYTASQASSANNINKPALFYGDACTTSSYDVGDGSIGEILIKQPDAGAIGYIGALRVTWYFEDDEDLAMLNRGNAKLFWKEFFNEKKFQQGRALYDSKVAYMESDHFSEGWGSLNQEWERKNILSYNLLGDPEVDIYTNKPANASNPFIQDIYEGQLITTTIKDIKGKTVPYARVHLKASDGKYRTVYGDINGKVSFRLPAQANETYNVTITGHNLTPSFFNFITLSDNSKPEFIDEDCSPEYPTVSDNVCFDIEVHDSQSGIESVYLLKSDDDDFEKYTYYKMVHRLEVDKDDYKYTVNKLDPGKYYFLVVARDWANNKEILDKDSFEISIPIPLMDYILIISLVMVIAMAGISIFIAYHGKRKYLHTLDRLELTKN